jgi:sulfatase maturation enzyme AslB (radical SAM superfamily)
MCNANLGDESSDITYQDFKKYMEYIKPYKFLSLTISGGEPTMVKDMPEIIQESVKHFPFGVSLITNLYGKSKRFYNIIETALKNNLKISVSFDGFGEVADKLRGAKNVSDTVMKNIEWTNEKKKELGSKSKLTLHTVINDENLHQVNEIIDYSTKIGWGFTMAPVNEFDYLAESAQKLTYSEELKEIVERVLNLENNFQQEKFIKGIIAYSQKQAPKLCPYLKTKLKNYKIFLEPDGSIYLCDRSNLGNINKKPLHEMFQGEVYEKSIEGYKKCKGCWLECFVSPMLYGVINKEARKLKFDL